jgi:hypothetical protein
MRPRLTLPQLIATIWAAGMVVIVTRMNWLDPNWRHELSNAVIAWAVLGVLGLVVLGAVAFWKWQGEKQHANKPDFKLSMLGGNVFVSDQEPTMTGIALEVRIRNAGGPSIATDWTLTVHPREGQPVMVQLTKPPKSLTLNGPGTGIVQLREEDFSLERLALATPLKADAPPLQSQLLFYVPLPKATVIAQDSVLTLSVSDLSGRTFSAVQRMGDWPQR